MGGPTPAVLGSGADSSFQTALKAASSAGLPPSVLYSQAWVSEPESEELCALWRGS